jgi:hypothetical protein
MCSITECDIECLYSMSVSVNDEYIPGAVLWPSLCLLKTVEKEESFPHRHYIAILRSDTRALVKVEIKIQFQLRTFRYKKCHLLREIFNYSGTSVHELNSFMEAVLEPKCS